MKTHRYEQVAERLAERIRNQSYPNGSRLPGTRTLAKEQGVSINTVLEAQKLLADWGMVRPEPRAGHFVCWQPPADTTTRPVNRFRPAPRPVGRQGLTLRMLADTVAPGIVNFGGALPHPDFYPVNALRRCTIQVARTTRDAFHDYNFAPGDEALRVQLARRMAWLDCPVPAEEVHITVGGHEALVLALKAVTRPGDIVALESPGYYGLLQIIESLGLKVLEIPTHPDTGMDLDRLVDACEQWPVSACVVIPSFSNPQGSLMPEANKRRLLALMEERGIPLIEDDIYGDLPFDGQRPPPIKAFDRNGQVLYCNSVSKTISPGLHLGWLIAGKYDDRIAYLKHTHTLSTPLLPQRILAAYLATDRHDRHLRRIRRQYSDQVARISEAVLRYFPEGTRISAPRGGFLLWISLPTGHDTLTLYDKALKKGISISPGPLFTTSERYRSDLRLNCAVRWDERSSDALRTLARLARHC